MFKSILRILDLLTILFSAVAGYSLWTGGSNLLSILLIILSPLLLLLAKYHGNRYLLFAAYITTTVYFTAIIYNGLSNSGIDFFQSDFNVLLIGAAAVLLSIIAAVIGFGTNTLTILWLSLHALVTFETIRMSSGFLSHFWSDPVVETAVRNDYPFLLMVVWIGLFLDKYQSELTRDYLSR
ncbi:hypothetical protein QUF94_02295 [Peribacillus sp. NJ4]|uniref:hypothetical protein n=1 Tax=Peribacillus TaxID=2675229 RepID=UPI0025A144D2|nr:MULTISPECIES: hypothetical protein [unclassified Peribacillus]MDM5210301.1 hypothetical protein [Peribacillus sp. NJ4]MDM5220586.1 hypothetical protein [Peribacillus sp. NJ11]